MGYCQKHSKPWKMYLFSKIFFKPTRLLRYSTDFFLIFPLFLRYIFIFFWNFLSQIKFLESKTQGRYVIQQDFFSSALHFSYVFFQFSHIFKYLYKKSISFTSTVAHRPSIGPPFARWVIFWFFYGFFCFHKVV